MEKPEYPNSEKIKQIVREIMTHKVTNKPYDFLFRENINNYPKINHKLLKLPGTFKNKENTTIFDSENGNLEMDYAESIFPDGKMVKREAAIDLEQETGKIKQEKVQVIFNYCLNTTITLKKPCYPFVATNHEYENDFLIFSVEGILLKIYLIIFDREKVYKILNTLSKKDYSKEEFSEEDTVLFTYCLVFAKKPYAQDVLEKLIDLLYQLKTLIRITKMIYTRHCAL